MTATPPSVEPTMWTGLLHAGLAGSFMGLPHVAADVGALRRHNAKAAIYGTSFDATSISRLRIVSGFEAPDTGSVSLDGSDITHRRPERRPVNMVFQSYALFPHMSVADNVGYGLRVNGARLHRIREAVDRMLRLVDLGDVGPRSVIELSGGQQQRVALARALVNEPRILLLDEPPGALDLKLRKYLQEELRSIQQRLGTTFIYVTHDQEEALTMSDRIAVMHGGELIQVGAPEEIYTRPVNQFVAGFVGESNLLSCEVVEMVHDDVRVKIGSGEVVRLSYFGGVRLTEGETVVAMVRPEQLQFVAAENAHFVGQVRSRTFLGSNWRYDVEVGSGNALRVLTRDVEATEQTRVGLRLREEAGVVLREDLGSSAVRTEELPRSPASDTGSSRDDTSTD